MPKVSDMFPRKYLQGEVLQGADWRLTIRGVGLEEMADPQNRSQKTEKWVLRFQEIRQGVILNSTRACELKDALGSDDTEDWIGEPITLYTEKEHCFGQVWDVLHFRPVRDGDKAPGQQNGNVDLGQAFAAFVQAILKDIPFYESPEHVQTALKECGYTTFRASQATKMRNALEEHATQARLRQDALDDLPF